MFCPQCGNEAQSGVQYCRSCGANLKVIGKAVALSEAIARSDRGPLPKIKEMVKGLKVEHVTEEVSRALEKMNTEIARISPESQPKRRNSWTLRRKKTPEERREQQITKGVVSFFSGVGITVFLYYLSAALVLKLPPHIVNQIPFELDPVIRVIWLLGLVPILSGVGHIAAGLLIPRSAPRELASTSIPQVEFPEGPRNNTPHSVTEHTTELLSTGSVPVDR